jgi:sulfur-oxidizing protein SoxY
MLVRKAVRLGVFVGCWVLAPAAGPAAATGDPTGEHGRWEALAETLFAGRSIHEGPNGPVRLTVPFRPDNAAAVPVAIEAGAAQSPDRYVQRVLIVVDNNPDPVAAVFHLTPDSGLADLSTNVRVQTHGPVRAVAEMNSGELYMSSALVKASGGCAAAPLHEEGDRSAHPGTLLVRVQNDSVRDEPNRAQIIITHPNTTGLQVDPLKGYPIPAHFITTVSVRYDGRDILRAETGISISEDPTLRFYYVPRGPGTLTVDVSDSRGMVLTGAVRVDPR